MEVGVRKLKEQLSAYLDRAANGEQIVVTERGRAKAVLGPLPGADNVRRGIRDGWITPARATGPPPAAPVPAKARRTIQEMMDEDRGSDE